MEKRYFSQFYIKSAFANNFSQVFWRNNFNWNSKGRLQNEKNINFEFRPNLLRHLIRWKIIIFYCLFSNVCFCCWDFANHTVIQPAPFYSWYILNVYYLRVSWNIHYFKAHILFSCNSSSSIWLMGGIKVLLWRICQ